MSELFGRVEEGAFLGKPLRIFYGEYSQKREGLSNQDRMVPVHLAIHPNLSRRIIINVPGTRGDIDGYADKYKLLGHYMQSQGLAATIRTGNDFTGLPPDAHLNSSLAYAQQHAWEICGEPSPEILLMGFSAGASAIAARAFRHPEVTRILLGAPATAIKGINVREGMRQFKGEVYILIGANDENVGTDSGQIIYNWAERASHKELFVIPDCDHQFRGEKNGRIVSKAPFYAFGKDAKPSFPDPEGGIKLYD